LPAIAVGHLAQRRLEKRFRGQARSYKEPLQQHQPFLSHLLQIPPSLKSPLIRTRHKYFKTLLSDHLASCTMTYDISAGLVLHPQK
jgi:hypothetical protein